MTRVRQVLAPGLTDFGQYTQDESKARCLLTPEPSSAEALLNYECELMVNNKWAKSRYAELTVMILNSEVRVC